MSETARDVAAVSEGLATVEFLGSSFADRRNALRRARAFTRLVEEAMADSVEAYVGQTVHAVFRPAMATSSSYPNVWVPCYSIMDEEREPRSLEVTVLGIDKDAKREGVKLGACPQEDGSYDMTYVVSLGNILEITELSEEAKPSN